ncbi:hypothetical protein J4H49_14460 [Vibrio alginolyticus]|uniref:hypothetical protein n=1 Tax=Vibrio alginolyticus TaxID=663 RepID=UPI001BD677CC|nr:hypothetical protein [Vibrio alginolyticus]MBT0039886.1 hypothetical protein [Vibrio alginolyticus]
MKLKDLCEQYPQYNKEQILKLRTLYYNIKARCNSSHEHFKSYKHVAFDFKDITHFIDWIISESKRGRDYFKINKPHVSRLFDQSNYSPKNCVLKPASANARESGAKSYKVYDSLTGKTSYFQSLRWFYNKNKHVLNISLSKLYRLVNNQEIIEVTNGSINGFIKIYAID